MVGGVGVVCVRWVGLMCRGGVCVSCFWCAGVYCVGPLVVSLRFLG